MKLIPFLLIQFLMVNLVVAQNPNNWDTAWICSYGGPNIDYGKDLKETPDKGFIIAGSTGSFGNGQTSFYMVKTDSLGNYHWSKTFGTTQNDLAYSIELANDGGYFIAGTSNGNDANGYDAYLIKTDKSGNALWTKNYGGSDWDFIYNSCKMPDGGLVLCGESYSGNNGYAGAYLLRVDSMGNVLWTKNMGGKSRFNVVKKSGNCLFAAGTVFDSQANKNMASIVKLDVNGNILKREDFGGTTSENLSYNDLCITRFGRMYLCGTRDSDTSDHCVLRQMDTTNLSPVYYMTNNGAQHFNSITEGKNSEIYVIAKSKGNIAGIATLCLRYDSVFSQLAYDFYDGKYDDEACKIIKTSKGFGMIGYTTTFGNTTTKLQNVFLVVLNKHFMPSNHFVLVNEFTDNLSPVNIKKVIGNDELKIFPNPFQNNLNILIEENNNSIEIILINALGVIVKQQNFNSNGKMFVLNTNELMQGIYFLKIFNDNKLITSKKIIKQ